MCRLKPFFIFSRYIFLVRRFYNYQLQHQVPHLNNNNMNNNFSGQITLKNPNQSYNLSQSFTFATDSPQNLPPIQLEEEINTHYDEGKHQHKGIFDLQEKIEGTIYRVITNFKKYSAIP